MFHVLLLAFTIVCTIITACGAIADRNARRRAPEYVQPRLPELAVATVWRRRRKP